MTYTLCIIGFGISGIVTSKYAKENNINYIVLEKEASYGGVWRDNQFNSTLQTPKYYYQFSDYPMPNHYPEYPNKQFILEYLQNYITYYELDLKNRVHFSSKVVACRYIISKRKWEIQYIISNNNVNNIRIIYSDYLCICSGYFSSIRHSNELQNYTGILLNSQNFSFKYIIPQDGGLNGLNRMKKNLLVIGNGASANDFFTYLNNKNNVKKENNEKSLDLYNKINIDILIKKDKFYITRYVGNSLIGHISTAIVVCKALVKVGELIPQWLFYLVMKIVSIVVFKNNFSLPREKFKYNNLVVSNCIPELMERNLITPIRDTIEKCEGTYIFFKNRMFRKYDIIMNCSGYMKTIDFLSPKVADNDTLECYNYIINSDYKNCGFIGYAPSYNWLKVSEIQAQYFIYIILGKIEYPSDADIETFVEKNKPKDTFNFNDLTYKSFNYIEKMNRIIKELKNKY